MPNLNNKTSSISRNDKAKLFIKNNGISILMGIFVVVLLVNPNAKAWVLQKLMYTGLFNPTIEKVAADLNTSAVDFSFVDENGFVTNSASLKGKVVFINFWASWCGPCLAEFPSIEKLYSKFKNNPNVYFVMINVDDEISKAKSYLERKKFTVPLHQAYGILPDAMYTGTLPTTVVLDKKGNIRFNQEGFANYASEDFSDQMELLLNE